MISAAVREQVAMLASPSTKYGSDAKAVLDQLMATGRYLADVKHDGVRALAYVEDGKAWIRNRNDVDISHRYPEIIEALEDTFPAGEWVLDGEMLCFADGKPTFKAIATRDAQSNRTKIAALAKASPATYMAFDILWHGGHDVRGLPLQARGTLLANTFRPLEGNTRLACSSMSDDGETMWAFVEQHSLEGLILKEKDGTYVGRRAPGWVKVKPVRRISAIVTGVQEGKGSREGKIGALVLSLFDPPTTDTPHVLTAVENLTQGDLVDLENDKYADPVEKQNDEHSSHRFYEFEYARVYTVQRETPECTVVQFEESTVGFPVGHQVPVHKGTWTPCGKVGTGMKGKDLDELMAALTESTANGEFLVVDVEYQELTSDGQLRFPSYRGIRMDVSYDQCGTSQLA